MLKVKIKSEAENFQIPVKGSAEACCYDVYASRIEYKPDGLVIVYLGFSTEIEEGYKGVLVPRSNISKIGWCIPNSPGKIDSDYRGEWQARFRPLPVIKDVSNDPEICDNRVLINDFPYKVGERVAQIYFEKETDTELHLVDETNDTERGVGGHGSTGLK